LISGTPTATGTTTVTLGATNAGGTGNKTLTITVTLGKPVITSATTATGQVGVAFSYQITATNTPTGFAASPLPAGVTVNTTTGLISGTPTTTGTTNVSLTATNATGTSTPVILVLTINPAKPVINSATTATGQVGVAFSYQITATNSPTSFAASPLPAGVTVNTTTGLISGTPTTAGTTSVSMTATNAGGTSTAVTLVITINPAKPSITSPTTATGQVGVPFSYQITASNSPTSFGASPLPAGLAINATTGLISGTPVTVGTTNVSLTATNATGISTPVTLVLTINPPSPVITPPNPINGRTGAAFTYQITANNNPTSYSATGLPPGLSINTTTGLISGTPTAPGIYPVTIGATNSGGAAAPVVLTITILASLPYTADFEPAEGYVLGSLNGQLGWTVNPGVSVVSNLDFAHAAQSVQLSPGNPPSVIGQTFASSPGQTVEFFDFFAKPVAGTPPGTASTFTIEESEFAFQLSGGQGVLQVFSGNGSGGGAWVSTPYTIPLGAGNQAQNWIRLSVRLDFTTKLWDLYANSQMVAADIPFISNSSTYLSTFQLQGDIASTSGLDKIYAGPVNQLFADVNNDGIDDVWETAHGLSLATDNRNLSPSGSGITVLQAYIAGTDPNDFYNGVTPTLAIVSGNNQTADSGQFNGQPFVVSVKDSTGSAPLVNAPVIFTVQSGGGKLAQTNTGSPSLANTITVRTDTNGMAQLYYQQPAGYSVASTVSVAAGNAQTSFATVSATPPVPKTIGGLRLFLRADAGTTVDGTNKISVWSDQGLLGNDASQGTATSQPILVPNALNGLPVVRFNGSGQFFNLPNLMAGAAAGEMFVVVKAAQAVPSAYQSAWQFGNNVCYYPHVSGELYEDFGSTTRIDLGQPTSAITQYNLYNVSADSTSWAVRLNGGLLYARTGNSVSFRSTPTIGASSVPYYFTGDIAEIIIYDHALTAQEREAVGVYCASKYALPSIQPPVAPTGLTAMAISPTQVNLGWAAASAKGIIYTIERRQDSGPYTVLGEVTDATGYFDTGLTANTAYTYRIKARDYAGSSAYSVEISATTLASGNAFPTGGMRLWLKADDGPLATTQGISVWQDRSGLGNDAMQLTGANRPQLVANYLNGRPVVRFNGTSSSLNLPNFMSGATAGEMFVVLKTASATQSQPAWDFGGSYMSDYPSNGGLIYESFGSASGQRIPVPTALNAYQLYEVSAQVNNWQARFNGALEYSTTSNSVEFTTTPSLGGIAGTGFFAGDIAEFIIYDHVLTTQERETVNTYLGSKYALYPAPVAPTGLSATAISNTQVSLVWSGPTRSDQVTCEIERQTGSGSFVKVGETASLSYIDSGLTAGTDYTYRVRMRAYTGTSAYSATMPATTLAGGSNADLPVAGMRLWLKADAVLSAGAGVGAWSDQSGLGNNASSVSGTNQPQLVANALNGLPVVRFSGSDQYFNLPNLMAGATAGEMFVVLKAVITRQQGAWNFGTGDVTNYLWLSGRVYECFGSDTPKNFVPVVPLDAYHVYNVSSQANNWQARFNGVAAYSTTSNTVAFNSTPQLGGPASGSGTFAGDMAEVIIFDHVLTTAERETANYYLSRKYALNLPITVTGGSYRDSNGDGLTDAQDVAAGIDPFNMDVDGDGIPNHVEIANGTNPFDTDTDHDGVPDGVDAFPNDPLRWDLANTPPTLIAIGGNNQIAQVGVFNAQPLSITVMNSAGTTPLVNAPVSFAVQSGGGLLALTNTGTPTLSATLNLNTDATGRVQVYYQQPAVAYTPSTIRFTAGSAQTTFASTSTVTGDLDNNGLADAWEIQNFGHTGVDPNADPDADGLTNLQEFQQGTDPNDFYNAVLPTLAIVSGNNQTAAAGQFNAQPYVISVKNAAGTAPWVNAPVTFTVLTQGGQLALTNTGTPAMATTLTLATDSNGRVQVYFLQPGNANLVSTVLVGAGLAQVEFNSSNPDTVAGPVDSDHNGLPDAWELQYFGHLGVDPNAVTTNGDGLTNLQEFQLGRNPTKAAQPDTNAAVNLRVYSPTR